jgi:hypothetical protein
MRSCHHCLSHRWFAISALFVVSINSSSAAPLIVYEDALRNQHNDWSFVNHNLLATAPVHGGTNSIALTPANWGGLLFVATDANQVHLHKRASDYAEFVMWVHGGSAGGQRLRVSFVLDGFPLAFYDIGNGQIGGAIAANAWREVRIPLAAAGLSHTGFDGVMIQDFSGATPGSSNGLMYLDDLQFVERTGSISPAAAIAVSVDSTVNRRAVSSEIYGVSFALDSQRQAGLFSIDRWGGNSVTRYNWQTDVHNTAADYFYQNIASSIANPAALPLGSDADLFVQKNKAANVQSLITIPTIGWAPKPGRDKRWGFSVSKYGPQDQNECSIYNPPPSWCSADAGNGGCQNVTNNTGFCQGGRIVGNDPTDTSMTAAASFYGNWITHLRAQFGAANTGNASAGGVRYFALDNEPMLWDSTHRDVHPAAVTIDEVWNKGRATASAIRAIEPNAQIFGPVTWGWCDLFYSGSDNCAPGPDYQAHGSKPFMLWYLEQACANPLPGGGRVIDVLDVHYYPQGDGIAGVDNNDTNSETPDAASRRLRSLRELYDPSFVAQSWINDNVRLIPRLKTWINQACPNIRLAITEYKWGTDNGPSSALAQAEILGSFAREGVDLAMRWTAPAAGSRSETAFRLFRNYNGAGGKITGDSIRANSADADLVQSFAYESPGAPLYLVLINKDTQPRPVQLTLNAARNGTALVYRYDGIGTLSAQVPLNVSGTSISVPAIPGRSMQLVILPATGLVEFRDGFE